MKADPGPLLLQPMTLVKAILHLVLLASVFAAGCQVDEIVNPAPIPPKCQLPVVGDPNADPEIEIIAIGPDYKLETLSQGSHVSLLLPPASGRVIFVGARVRNMNPCGARLEGEIKDPSSGQKRVDYRLINLLVTNDGWASSDRADVFTMSNLAVCPNQWADQDIFDNEFELKVSVKDRDGRQVSKTINVIPKCNEPGQEAGCQCQCNKDYILGQPCPIPGDAGP